MLLRRVLSKRSSEKFYLIQKKKSCDGVFIFQNGSYKMAAMTCFEQLLRYVNKISESTH